MSSGSDHRLDFRHKTLSAYYPHLQTLHDYLTSSNGDNYLLLQKDTPDYRNLVTHTICAFHNEPMCSSIPATGEVYGSQQEAIDRILKELGRAPYRSGEGRNVLLSGDKVCPLTPKAKALREMVELYERVAD